MDFRHSHGAFMGLIMKPWGERERSDLSVLGELQGKFMGVAGVNTFATAPSAIPVGAGEMPVEFVITYPGDYTQLASTLDAIDAEAKKSGLFIFTNADLRFSTPQAELVDRQGPRQQARRYHAGCWRHAGNIARRQQREPVCGSGPELSGDPAGAARRSRHALNRS